MFYKIFPHTPVEKKENRSKLLERPGERAGSMNDIARAELRKYMDQYGRDHSIADLTPTVCELCGVRLPEECGASAIASVVDHGEKLFGGAGLAEKVLLFCPDACADHQRDRRPDVFEKIEKIAGMRIRSTSVMPSVTPVCYGSIFSGTSPAVHGIQKYEKPVLRVETLFDVFAEAGKKVTILSVNGCSIDTIFRRRAIDYFSFRNDEDVHRWTLKLLKECDYDLVVSYMTGYDETAHHTGIFSGESMKQLELAAERFARLADCADAVWSCFNRLLAFVPDHGQHPAAEDQGTHGENLPEDMLTSHYYRLRRRR